MLGLRPRLGLAAPRVAASSGGGGAVVPATNLTARYISNVLADFNLTGSSINTHAENNGNTDLDIIYISDTKALRQTTHPINTSEATVDTNNADCLHGTAADGTLADYWPSGVGAIYIALFVDSHPDRFSAPDWFMYFGTALRISVKDGPILNVDTNAGAQTVSTGTITLDAWHLISIRSVTGVDGLRIQIDDEEEAASTGLACVTLTDVMRMFYSGDDAGRFDGAYADIAVYSATDAVGVTTQRDAVKAAFRALYNEL